MLSLRDVERLLDQLSDTIQGYVRSQVAASAGKLAERLAKIEAAFGNLKEPRDGKDGASISLDDVRPLILAEIERAVAAIPKPKDGLDGRDGVDIDGDVLLQAALAVLRPELRALVESIPKAKNGENGKNGRDGEDGTSVTVEQVLAMVEKSVANIPKPRDGRDGTNGDSISLEALDRLIADRISLAMTKLPPARDGLNGEPGRDAMEIQILGALVPGRSYQRGTYAHHAGGIVTATRDTDPGAATLDASGWRVMVEGLAAIVVTQKAERTFVVACQMTSGRQVLSEFSVPVVIERGVWKADRTYEIGDGVTWDGSYWIAQKATGEKPGTSDSWRLAVKRGRDGRDFSDAPRVATKPVRIA